MDNGRPGPRQPDRSRWIEIVGWDRFQHYKDRRPTWIKVYLSLLDDAAFLELPIPTQLLLVKLWLMYAITGRFVLVDTAKLSRRLGQRVTNAQLELLNHAGFIRIRASRPLAQTETENEALLQTETVGASALPVNNHPGNHLADTLLGEIQDADQRTAAALIGFEKRLPDAAFAAALESLRHRRKRRDRPPLASEARYVVAALATMDREGQYRHA